MDKRFILFRISNLNARSMMHITHFYIKQVRFILFHTVQSICYTLKYIYSSNAICPLIKTVTYSNTEFQETNAAVLWHWENYKLFIATYKLVSISKTCHHHLSLIILYFLKWLHNRHLGAEFTKDFLLSQLVECNAYGYGFGTHM